jgi:hypothetical protein
LVQAIPQDVLEARLEGIDCVQDRVGPTKYFLTDSLRFAGSLVERGLMVGDLHFPPSVEVALQWGECSTVEDAEHGARNRDRGCNQCRDELRIHRNPKV